MTRDWRLETEATYFLRSRAVDDVHRRLPELVPALEPRFGDLELARFRPRVRLVVQLYATGAGIRRMRLDLDTGVWKLVEKERTGGHDKLERSLRMAEVSEPDEVDVCFVKARVGGRCRAPASTVAKVAIDLVVPLDAHLSVVPRRSFHNLEIEAESATIAAIEGSDWFSGVVSAHVRPMTRSKAHVVRDRVGRVPLPLSTIAAATKDADWRSAVFAAEPLAALLSLTSVERSASVERTT